MDTAARMCSCLMVAGLLAGCTGFSPAPRLEAYLGPSVHREPAPAEALQREPGKEIRATMVVVNDTSGPRAAPALSEENLTALSTRLRDLVEASLPITITDVLMPEGIEPRGDPRHIRGLVEGRGTDYVLVAIISSVENEVPAQLPLQGFQQGGLSRGTVLGYQAENYALVELALLDASTSVPLVQSAGRAWSTLERLNVPLESNVYPVVRRSQRIAPIYPTEANAKDVMRGVSADEAIDQAVMHFAKAWKQRFDQAAG